MAIFGLLGVLSACGGGGDDPTPSPTASPTQTPRVITPGPTAEPPATEYRLVYREAGATEDIIWSLSPNDPAAKSQLAVIPHREGFSVRASVSPDGTYLAYLSLPESARSVDSSQAEAYLLDLTAPPEEPDEPVKIADGVDYLFTPLWAPDGGLLYMRRYAGPEFLNAVQTIIRVRVFPQPAPNARTPSPTPTPEPGIEPWPGPDTTVLTATVANVLRWTPMGFSADGESMLFLEERGGTSGQTVVGIYSPATSEDVDALYKTAEEAWYAAQLANKQAADEAAANGQDPPAETVTPAPTRAPDARLVVPLSEQSVTEFALSPDRQRVAYLDQSIADDGSIGIATHLADLIEATTTVIPLAALSPGTHLSPCWYPDGRITASVLPTSGGPGQMAIVSLDQSSITLMVQPESGYDVPWGWAPDGSWLAVMHWSGSSLVNPGEGRLDLVSAGGHRLTLAEGAANAGRDSVVGWLKPAAAEDAG